MSAICHVCHYNFANLMPGQPCPNCSLKQTYVTLAFETPSSEEIDDLVQRADRIGVDAVPKIPWLGFPKLRGALNYLRRRTTYLTSGDAGVGKSTLLTQIAAQYGIAKLEDSPLHTLYVAAEEPREAVVERAVRVGCDLQGLWVVDDGNLAVVQAALAAETIDPPDLIIVDSIQTVFDPSLETRAGSVGQVVHCTNQFKRIAREHDCAVWLLAHVTKDGSVAGPKTLEHLVDVVTMVGMPDYERDRPDGRELVITKNRRGRLAGPVWFAVQPNGAWKEI